MMLLLLALLAGDVRPHGLFNDHMVLQRDRPVPVWGTADAGAKVEVVIAGKRASATAGKDGRWKLVLDPLPAGGPHELRIGERTLRNVMVGEVWLCSGQSNMGWSVRLSADPEKEIAAAKHPRLRLFTVPKTIADAPRTDVEGAWQACDPTTVVQFSAVAYHFGRNVMESQNVAVGLIHSSVGATRAQAWVSREALATVPNFQPNTVEQTPLHSLWNGMIAPLAPFGIRGVIWYQGEGNIGSPFVYRDLFQTLIRSWREAWGQGDFPFLYVQLANHLARRDPSHESYWAYLRDSQTAALSVPRTAMAVTIDIGDEADIHPKNKREVGRRLALAAEAVAYGRSIVYSGPFFESARLEGGRVRVTFKHADGLQSRGPLKGFAIAGSDRRFVWADAAIEGATVVVSSPDVPRPSHVRYGWADNPEATLYNGAGLPAVPFRTDVR
ncbi:MAG TPA: sialate O-acetylesterase [Planctomycetota bacterium]|nr:sialate O-acetylesterase [Planctomycetota bacterium]